MFCIGVALTRFNANFSFSQQVHGFPDESGLVGDFDKTTDTSLNRAAARDDDDRHPKDDPPSY